MLTLAARQLQRTEPHRREIDDERFSTCQFVRLLLSLLLRHLLQLRFLCLLSFDRLCHRGRDAILELHAAELNQAHEQHQQIIYVQAGGTAAAHPFARYFGHLAKNVGIGAATTLATTSAANRAMLRRGGADVAVTRAQRWRGRCSAVVHARGTGERKR
jgi:hypothetical protein